MFHRQSVLAVVLGAVISLMTGCNSSPPTAPAPLPPGPATPTPGPTSGTFSFPELTRPATVYLQAEPDAFVYNNRGLKSRYVLYDDGTFALQFADVDGKVYEYLGRYLLAGADVSFAFWQESLAGPYGATATIAGDRLSVRYSDIMHESDFIDAVYVRTP